MTLKTLDSCSLVITGIFASFLLVACQPSEEVGGSDMPVSDTSPMDVSVAMPTEAITTFTTEHLASKSSFYIGGEYLGDPPVMGGQMYVDVWEPNNITQPYPIVLFHGNGQTGVGWQQTPDGRPGWAYYLLEQGYVLYMVDYPARGRSAYLPGGVHGDLGIRTAAQLQTIWTNVDEMGDFPLNDNHTQWPGEGKPGDPVFDEFIKTQVQFAGQSTTLARHAAIELLQEIGPVILLTHSQGGGVGFGVTDGAPGLVKALITVEPGGPQIG